MQRKTGDCYDIEKHHFDVPDSIATNPGTGRWAVARNHAFTPTVLNGRGPVPILTYLTIVLSHGEANSPYHPVVDRRH